MARPAARAAAACSPSLGAHSRCAQASLIALQAAAAQRQMQWTPSQARRHFDDGREIMLYGVPANDFDGTTTHKTDYVAHPLEARQPYQPVSPGTPLPFSGTSTYADTYHAHPLPERHHNVEQFVPSNVPFEGTTTYGANYVPHPLERAAPRPAPNPTSSLPFEGMSSYTADYHAHALPKHEHTVQAFQPQHIPFDGSSTYKGDFVPHALEPRQAAGAPMMREPLPFEGTTTYSDNFRPYPIQPHAAGKPVEYHGSGAKFEGMSETMDKYRAWAIDPNVKRAAPPPMRPSLPFDGTTTNREMFKGWQLPPRRPALGVQLVGNMAYVLIPAGSSVPATGRQVFTTVHDGQTEMDVLILEGDFSQASQCNVLGQLTFAGMAPAAKGVPKLEVTMHVDGNGVLNVTAHDLCSKRQEQWLREGYMHVQVANE